LQQSLGPETKAIKSELSRSSVDVLQTTPLEKAEATPHNSTAPVDEQETEVKTVELDRVESSNDALHSVASTEQAGGLVTEKDGERNALSKENVHALFSGAPTFNTKVVDGRVSPGVLYPWDNEVRHDTTDSVIPDQPSYMSATAHTHTITGSPMPNAQREHQVYQTDAFETPNWLSAQGLEPGTVGFAHFVELPSADNLVTEPHHHEASEEFAEISRNKELMHSNPERIGIRAVEMDAVYNRLIEFQDLYETFQQGPERITILNNQSTGDLYAHLFSTFLTPPGYYGADLDPTGLQIQILTILKILNLKGIWHDFSLVEWRIRLGQVLFSDPEVVPEGEIPPLWTERDVLLLQISLSCELLLRLDAISATRAGEIDDQTHITAREIATFKSLTTRKTNWDMVVARRFLENVLVIRGDDNSALTPPPEKRGIFAILGVSTPKELPRSDVIFLPQHQSRQLSGLLHFAETINWPTIEAIVKSMAEKLGDPDQLAAQTPQAASPSAWTFNPTTPSVVSVYGTPLQTPRSVNHQLEDYFGSIQRPAASRNKSSSLRMPLSRTLLSPQGNDKASVVNIGGWLSRSFLTGMVLPGEAISHFLLSTLLENDELAMSALGDSADLYGGFVYSGRTWWSKASIVGRVFACSEGAQECMGWIYVDRLPEGAVEGWYPVQSEQLSVKSRTASEEDVVALDSAALPVTLDDSVKSTDFVMPKDLDGASTTSIRLVQWDLTALNTDLIDDDMGTSATGNDLYTPTVTFEIDGNRDSHVLTLTHEVQFVTSWPCFTPASTSALSPRHVVKRAAAGTLSHTSSKRSISASTKLSIRSSTHGFEPLLSHPPTATDLGPQRVYAAEGDEEQAGSTILDGPVVAHPLHSSYHHKVVPVASLLDPNFALPFTVSASNLPTCSSSTLLRDGHDEGISDNNHKTVLIIDARGKADAQLLARAWCAEKGYHALVGRVGRTCLACCIREARGLGINIVIRIS
jgi:hypothetical protein